MMRNDEVTFNARFGGKAFTIWLPMWSIMAIYARETQEWVSFPPEEYTDQVSAGDQTENPVEAPVLSLATATATTEVEPTVNETSTDGDEPPPAPKPTKSRPSLRVVK
jgi:stringent starvation protein B